MKQSFTLLLEETNLSLNFSLAPTALPQRWREGKPTQKSETLHKPAAADTAFLPWRPGLVPAFPRGSAGGREGRRTAQGRGCSAASESEGYCPCRTTEVSSSPLDPSDCPVSEHKQRMGLEVLEEMGQHSHAHHRQVIQAFAQYFIPFSQKDEKSTWHTNRQSTTISWVSF